MDQRPQDLPPRTDLDGRHDGSWSVLPILLVVAILAIGAWMLFADSAKPPTTATSESTPAAAPSPSPSATPAPIPSTPPSNSAPAPASKP